MTALSDADLALVTGGELSARTCIRRGAYTGAAIYGLAGSSFGPAGAVAGAIGGAAAGAALGFVGCGLLDAGAAAGQVRYNY